MSVIKRITVVLFIAVAALFIAYFANLNNTTIEINLIFAVFPHVPVWLSLLFAFLFGIIFSTLLMAWDITKTHTKLLTVKRENKKLKKKIAVSDHQHRSGTRIDSRDDNDGEEDDEEDDDEDE